MSRGTHGTYILYGNSDMLRTHEGKIKFVAALVLIKCLKTDQITEIAPYVRATFWVTILYKYRGGNEL